MGRKEIKGRKEATGWKERLEEFCEREEGWLESQGKRRSGRKEFGERERKTQHNWYKPRRVQRHLAGRICGWVDEMKERWIGE